MRYPFIRPNADGYWVTVDGIIVSNVTSKRVASKVRNALVEGRGSSKGVVLMGAHTLAGKP